MKPKTKRKPRIKAIEHRIESLDIEFTQRGKRRRLLRIQRHKKPVKVKDINISKNPDKISFLVLRTVFNDRLEIFCYKDNPKKFFMSLNGEFISLKTVNWREINSGVAKLGRYLGLFLPKKKGRRAKHSKRSECAKGKRKRTGK